MDGGLRCNHGSQSVSSEYDRMHVASPDHEVRITQLNWSGGPGGRLEFPAMEPQKLVYLLE